MYPDHDREQDLRKPIEATARLGHFLNNAISDLQQPQGQQTMAEVPPNTMPAEKSADVIRKNITGASQLGDAVMARIAAAKRRVTAANNRVEAAGGRIESAATHAESIATAIETEASDLEAKLGQFSNGAPE